MVDGHDLMAARRGKADLQRAILPARMQTNPAATLAVRVDQGADIGLDAPGIATRARVLRQADARGPRLRAG